MNFVDVEDVAAGHLLAADRGKPGERYILGGENLRLAALIDRVAELSGVRYPIMVLPASIRRVAPHPRGARPAGALSAEASNLMGQDWRFSSRKAREELGYESRPPRRHPPGHDRLVPRADRGRRVRRLPALRPVARGPTRCGSPRGSAC